MGNVAGEYGGVYATTNQQKCGSFCLSHVCEVNFKDDSIKKRVVTNLFIQSLYLEQKKTMHCNANKPNDLSSRLFAFN